MNCLCIVERANISRQGSYVQSNKLYINIQIQSCIFLNNYYYMGDIFRVF